MGQQGAAEQLEFEDDHFDGVISRYSAHHWQNIRQAMSEIFRVVKPSGKVILVDILGTQQPILDTFFKALKAFVIRAMYAITA